MNPTAKNYPAPRTHFNQRKLALAIAAHIYALSAYAGPTGGDIVGGAGSIEQQGTETTIVQSTDRLAIDWQSFDVGKNERVEFVQPGQSAVALNRILGNKGSEILGRIDANGHVILVNPRGVVFGESATINAGGLIASGLLINPNDFMNGDLVFKHIEGTDGTVINSGMINAAAGGNVVLLGQQVENRGLISAKLGSVILASGKEVVLTFDESGLLGVRVDEAVLQDELGDIAAVKNSGKILAENGRVLLSASTTRDVFSQAVNWGDQKQARSVTYNQDGSFTLGAGGDVVNSGNIIASAEDSAGDIVVLGENITNSGAIHADTINGSGGHVELHSNTTTKIIADGVVTANGKEGGDIKLLGKNVGLFDQATIEAIGVNGGGHILVGGDREGQNQQVRNADFVYINEAASVDVSTTDNGDGGTAIIYAEDTARIYGGVSVRGGMSGGDGGFIETSGKRGFEIDGAPDVSAPEGLAGHWLIDPVDIEIRNSSTQNVNLQGNEFTSTNTPARLRVDDLIDALNIGATVTVKTGSGSTGAGNILVSEQINLTANVTSTLNLIAHNNITINADITSSEKTANRKLNVNLNANTSNNQGSITFGNNTRIETGGGDFKIGYINDDGSINTSMPGAYDVDFSNVTIDVTGPSYNDLGTFDTYFGGRDPGVAQSDRQYLSDSGRILVNASNNVNLGGSDGSGAQRGAVTMNVRGREREENAEKIHMIAGNDILLNADRVWTYDNNATEDLGDGQSPYHGYTTLKLEAGGDIDLAGDITFAYNQADGDNRQEQTDRLMIDLAAGGSISIGGDIDTTGGNFRVRDAVNVDFSGQTIDTGSRYGAGDFSITATGNITLGSTPMFDGTEGDLRSPALYLDATGSLTLGDNNIATLGRDIFLAGSEIDFNNRSLSTTDSGDITLISGADLTLPEISSAGNFTIAARVPEDSSINVGQSDALRVEGSSTFNLGEEGNLTLQDADNFLQGFVGIESAYDVSLTIRSPNGSSNPDNRFSLQLGNPELTSNIKGNLSVNVTGDGGVKNPGALVVEGNTHIRADGDPVFLNNESNDFIGPVLVGDGESNVASSVSITTKNNLHLGFDGESYFSVAGMLQLKAGGDITQQGALTVQGPLSIAATNATLSHNGNLNLDAVTLAETLDLQVSGDLSQADNAVHAQDLILQVSGDAVLANEDNEFSSLSGSLNTATITTQSSLALGEVSFTGDSTITTSEIEQAGEWSLGDGVTLALTGIENLTLNNKVVALDEGAADLNIQGADTDSKFYIQPGFDAEATIVAIHGGGGDDNHLYGPDQENIWDINSEAPHSLNDTITFENIQRLIGGTGNDTFQFHSDTHTDINIDGGGGDGEENKVSYALVDGDLSVTLGDVTARLQNIHLLEGNYTEERNNAARLNVTGSGDYIWAIDGINSGTVGITDDNATTRFTGFNQLHGAPDSNEFFLNADLSGERAEVVGGAGKNRFVLDTVLTTAITGGSGTNRFELTENAQINGVLDGSAEHSTLVGFDADLIWEIQADNTVTIFASPVDADAELPEAIVSGVSGLSALLGGTETDHFRFYSVTHALQVDGGEGDNIADFSAISGAFQVALEANESLGLSRIQTLIGNGADATLIGPDMGADWLVTALNSGTVSWGEQNTQFEDFAHVRGGAGDDQFVLTDLVSSVDGGDGNNTLSLSDLIGDLDVLVGQYTEGFLSVLKLSEITANPDTVNRLISSAQDSHWVIDGANSGSLTADDQATEFTHFNYLQGLHNNQFTLEASGQVVELAGGDGDNTLTAENDRNNQWQIDGSNSGWVTGATADIRFLGIEKLQGGSRDDHFLFVNDDARVDQLIGGSGNNTMSGFDAVNQWLVNDTDSGTLNAGIAFSEIANLIGGASDDTFTFGANGTLSGLLSGGAGGDNTLNLTNIESVWRVGLVDSADELNLHLDQIHNIVGNGQLQLVGIEEGNTWQITAENAGDWTPVKGNNIVFSGVAELLGGEGDDTFLFSTADSHLSVDGGGGFNTADFSSITTDYTVSLGALEEGGISRVNAVVGNATEGITSTLEIIGNSENTWTFNTETSHKVSRGNEEIEFENFNHFLGGEGVDTFLISASPAGHIDGRGGNDSFYILAPSISADLIGGEGNNTLIAYQQSANTWELDTGTSRLVSADSLVTFTRMDELRGAEDFADTFSFQAFVEPQPTLVAGDGDAIDTIDYSLLTDQIIEVTLGDDGLKGFESVVGNRNHTLIGGNYDNTWELTSDGGSVSWEESAELQNTTQFSGFGHWVGGSRADEFLLATLTSAPASIHAGDGADILDMSAIEADLNIGLGLDAGGAINLAEIETIKANEGYSNTLTSSANQATWTIDGTNSGNLIDDQNFTVNFENFQNLEGFYANTFNLSDAGQLTGGVTGGDQESRLIMTGSADHAWEISDAGKGILSRDETPVLSFAKLTALQGGTGHDDFVLTSEAAQMGEIIGGGGTNSLSAAWTSDTLLRWEVIDGQGELIDHVGIFSDIAELVGQEGVDEFYISGTANLNQINSGAGDDLIHLSDSSRVTTILAGDGSDTITLTHNALAHLIDGGAHPEGAGDHLDLSNYGSPVRWNVAGAVINDKLRYIDIERVSAPVGDDIANTFQAPDSNNTWHITGENRGYLQLEDGNTLEFFSFANLLGGRLEDLFRFTVDGVITGGIDGGEGINTIGGSNAANAWVLNDINAGYLKNQTTEATSNFARIQNLEGGSGTDVFVIEESGHLSGTLKGGDGSDRLEHSIHANQIWTILDTQAGEVSNQDGDNVLKFAGVDEWIGSGRDHLRGNNVDRRWTLDDVGAGWTEDAEGGIQFNGFTSITGGAGTDDFIFDNEGWLSGPLDGGGGANTLLIEHENAVTVALSTGAPDEALVALGIQTITVSNNEVNALIGFGESVDGYDWNVDGNRSGTVTSRSENAEHEVAFSNFGDLRGGSQDDHFKVGDAAALVFIDGGEGRDTLDYSASTESLDITIGEGQSNGVSIQDIEVLIGNHDGSEGQVLDAILRADTGNNTWTIKEIPGKQEGINDGVFVGSSGQQMEFHNFNHLEGGSGNDRFILTGTGMVTGSISGGGGTQNQVDVSGIASTRSLTVDIGGQPESGQLVVKGIHELIGAGLRTTLTGVADTATWEVHAIDSGTWNAGNSSVTFSQFGHLLGGAGEDIFQFDSQGRITGWVAGGAGFDEVSLPSGSQVWLADDNGSGPETGAWIKLRTDLEQLDAGAGGINHLQLESTEENYWHFTNLNQGEVGDTQFSGFSEITGGAGPDHFMFSDEGWLSGPLKGGGGANTLLIERENAVTVALSTGAPGEALVALNIQTIEVDNEKTNTLMGASENAAGYNWVVDGQNSGIVSPEGSESMVAFNNFGYLIGGNKSDRFRIEIGGSVSRIDGGEGQDFVDRSQHQGNLEITIGDNLDTGGGFSVTSIEGLIGNGGPGSDWSATLKAQNGTNTWTIGDANETQDGINDGTFEQLNGTEMAFRDFDYLRGGSGDDYFIFKDQGILTGSIRDDGGNNRLDLRETTHSVQAVLFASDQPPRERQHNEIFVQGIQTLAGAGPSTVLVGPNVDAGWQINSSNAGTLSYQDQNQSQEVTFTDFGHLSGGDADDVFTFGPTGQLTGWIVGGGGHDAVHFNNGQREVAAWLADAAGMGPDSGQWHRLRTDIESVAAQANTQNRLKLESNGTQEWLINGMDMGTVAGVTFENFGWLIGGDGNDHFRFADGASLSRLLDGGDGDGKNLVNLSALTTAVSVAQGDQAGANLRIANIGEVVANEATADSNWLWASNQNNQWSISGVNRGSLNNSLIFNGFANLRGGNEDDRFIFRSSGKLGGQIDGGGHVDGDMVDYASLIDELIVDLSGSADLVNIERLIGNEKITLRGPDQSATWRIAEGNDQGQLFYGQSQELDFSGVSKLQGGNATDEFIFAAGASITNGVNGGAGADHFIVELGGSTTSHTTLLVGGESGEGDTLEFRGGGENWSGTWGPDIEGAPFFSFTSPDSTAATRFGYSNIETIQVQASLDQMILTDQLTTASEFYLGPDSWRWGDLESVFYQSAVRALAVDGDSADTIHLSGTINFQDELLLRGGRLESESNTLLKTRDLVLEGLQNAGSEETPLNISTDALALIDNAGALYLREENGVTLVDLKGSKLVDLQLRAGDLTQPSDGAINSSGNLRFSAEFGVIKLSSQDNHITGTVGLLAAKNADLYVSGDVLLAEVGASNLYVNATGNIASDAAVVVSGVTDFISGGEINIRADNNELNQMSIRAEGDVFLQSTTPVSLGGVITDGNLQVTASGITLAGEIKADALTANSDVGGLNVFGQVMVDSDIVLDSTGSLVMSHDGKVESEAGNISITTGGDQKIGFLTAHEADVFLRSGGAISDSNDSQGPALNIKANVFNARAERGIGAGNPLELEVTSVDLVNERGEVGLSNTGPLVVERIHNAGDISLTNSTDVTFIKESVNAFFGTEEAQYPLKEEREMPSYGGDFSLEMTIGNIKTDGSVVLNQPHIAAKNVSIRNPHGVFLPPSPVIYAPQRIHIISGRSRNRPYWGLDVVPDDIDDETKYYGDAVGAGEQLIDVESLADIDPAIFTPVRNYVYQDVSIRLPSDQLYEDE